MLSAKMGNFGATRCMTGKPMQKRIIVGGQAESVELCNCTMKCVLITFEHLLGIGRFPPMQELLNPDGGSW